MVLLQDKMAQQDADFALTAMSSPRPDEGCFFTPSLDRGTDFETSFEPVAQSRDAVSEAYQVSSRASSSNFMTDNPVAATSSARRITTPGRLRTSRKRSDRQPDRPVGMINDENANPLHRLGLSPGRRDSRATLEMGGKGEAEVAWESLVASSKIAHFGLDKDRPNGLAIKLGSGTQSPVQTRPSSKRTIKQRQRDWDQANASPTWSCDPFTRASHAYASSVSASMEPGDMDIADVLNSNSLYDGTRDISQHPTSLDVFPDKPNMIQPIPMLNPRQQADVGQDLGSALGLLAAGFRKPPSYQALGQPFSQTFDKLEAMGGEKMLGGARAIKAKKHRRASDVSSSSSHTAGGLDTASTASSYSSTASNSSSSNSTASSSTAGSTPGRVRVPSHTSLLLGLSLGPAFGDEVDSTNRGGVLMPHHQLAEAQVPSISPSTSLGGGHASGRKEGKRRGGQCQSIERVKVTKAARLPLGGSPSFGLNIMGLGDALELDSAYIYLEKGTPVPSIVITPPPVLVAHTPSRLARSESRSGPTLLLAMAGMDTVVEEPGSKLAPAPISTDSPSVRSISNTLAMTAMGSANAAGPSRSDEASYQGEIISPPRSMSPPPTARVGCAPGEWSTRQSFASPPEIDSNLLPIIQQRMAEDQAAFTELALEIDVILSEYIYINSPTQAWIVGRRLTALLLSAVVSGPAAGLGKAPPTLRKVRQVGEERLPEDWVETESERLLEKVLDHVITGILVVLADPRSPFETPQSLAQLCCSLKMSLSAPSEGHNPEASGLSPYGGIVSGPPSPPQDASSTTSSTSSPTSSHQPDLGALFEDIVHANLRDILQRGEDVRDRAHRLEVPLARKGNRRKWELASSERLRASADQHKNRKLAAKGLISGDEFVKLERKRAAKGHARDQFADISVLRFVGELYRVSFLSLPDVQSWLERMLFDTVYPGVPSIYELGCACALITIVGPQLEAIADKEDRQAYEALARAKMAPPPAGSSASGPTARVLPVPETPIRSASAGLGMGSIVASASASFKTSWTRPLRTDAPPNHWIQYSPAAVLRSPGATSPFSTSMASSHTAATTTTTTTRSRSSTRTVSCGSGKLSLSSFGSLHSVQSSCSSNWSGGLLSGSSQHGHGYGHGHGHGQGHGHAQGLGSALASSTSTSGGVLSPPPSAKGLLEAGYRNEARLTVTSCMDRFEELLRLDELEDGVKDIIRSVLGLYSRGWTANPIPFTPTRFVM